MSQFDLFGGYDDVEPSQGFDGDPLPGGWYPVEIDRVMEVAEKPSGSVQARMQLSVLEGPFKKRKAFVMVVLGPALTDREGRNRPQEEIANTTKVIQAQMKGLLKALDVQTGDPVGNNQAEKCASFYNIPAWEGRQFIARISLQKETAKYPARNNLNAFHNVNSAKRGMEWWRQQPASSEDTTVSAGKDVGTV